MAINKVVNNGETLIDLTQDTVQATSLLEGEKAHNRAGEQIVGVMLNLSNDTVTPQTLGKGATAHNRAGEQIVGVMESGVNTSDANAIASDILNGKTAYVKGSKIIGSMPNNYDWNGTITDLNSVSIPVGFHSGTGSIEISITEKNKLIPSNIKNGVTILGVTGNFQGNDGAGGTTVKTGTTTSQSISTGLSHIDKFILYSEKLTSDGLMSVFYDESKPNTSAIVCLVYSVNKICGTIYTTGFEVNGGTFTWKGEQGRHLFMTGATYNWIAIGS